jgi:acyl carrier protein
MNYERAQNHYERAHSCARSCANHSFLQVAQELSNVLALAAPEDAAAGKLLSMSHEELMARIQAILNQILDAKGVPRVELSEHVPVLDGTLPIDSLDLAQIVIELQSVTGKDPFREGFIQFRTVGELARLFAAS